MAWFADLDLCTYFDDSFAEQEEPYGLIAVGWLERGHDYTRGSVDEAVRMQLRPLVRHVWSPFMYLGSHPCELCVRPESGERGAAQVVPECPSSFLNLLIPGRGRVYASPELVAHYIEAHQYRPPYEFCDAVLACPPMWSDAYFEALQANGSDSFRSLVDAAAEGMEAFREHMLQRRDVPGVA